MANLCRLHCVLLFFARANSDDAHDIRDDNDAVADVASMRGTLDHRDEMVVGVIGAKYRQLAHRAQIERVFGGHIRPARPTSTVLPLARGEGCTRKMGTGMQGAQYAMHGVGTNNGSNFLHETFSSVFVRGAGFFDVCLDEVAVLGHETFARIQSTHDFDEVAVAESRLDRSRFVVVGVGDKNDG